FSQTIKPTQHNITMGRHAPHKTTPKINAGWSRPVLPQRTKMREEEQTKKCRAAQPATPGKTPRQAHT
ncbi:hypothetical protein ACQKGC_04605, partial [Allorhizobium pseudoryzae]|uniref:hypothetical protein n=1 Tax=Allorhizobium pseudoryzae TaxID=379684 RepID=UPI003CFC3677